MLRPVFPLAAIGTAYAVLSNPEKRKQYDQFGDDKNQAARHGHSHGDFHRGFEADISPEDLFNMFFGGGFPSSKSTASSPQCDAGQDLTAAAPDFTSVFQVTSMSTAMAECDTPTSRGRTAETTRVM